MKVTSLVGLDEEAGIEKFTLSPQAKMYGM
jgi:hypothetical protein